jgi:hypothetical protein
MECILYFLPVGPLIVQVKGCFHFRLMTETKIFSCYISLKYLLCRKVLTNSAKKVLQILPKSSLKIYFTHINSKNLILIICADRIQIMHHNPLVQRHSSGFAFRWACSAAHGQANRQDTC